MKRPGLTPHLIAATLFLASGLQAEESTAAPDTSSGAAKSDATENARGMARRKKAGDDKPDAAPPPRQPARPGAKAAENPRAQMLRRLDRNADGKIDDRERTEGLKFVAGHLDQFPGIEQRFDRDGNGRLDEKEQAALDTALGSMANSRGPMANGGGSREGAPPSLEALPPAARELALKRFDRDGDGKLNDDETAAFRTEYRRRRAERMAQRGIGRSTAPAKPEALSDPEEEARLNRVLDEFSSRLNLFTPPPKPAK